MSQYCRYCGTQMSDDDKFCPGCGKAVDVVHVESGPSFGRKDTTYTNQTVVSDKDESTFYGLATASWIIGIISCVTFGSLSFIGLVLGIISMCSSKVEDTRKKGKLGVILNCVSIGIVVLIMIVAVVFTVVSVLSITPSNFG